MQTARRLYVYLLSGIALGVLVAGLSILLTVLFDALGLRGGSEEMFGGGDTRRQQLTLASALTVVSLPLWLAHWIAAERSVAVTRPTASAERNSDVRGMYFAIAMSALLLAAAIAARGLIEALVVSLAAGGASDQFGFFNPAGDLALLLVAGAAWGYHVAIRNRDWRTGPLEGPGAYLPRTYLYLATFVGLMLLLFGLVSLLELAGRLILDEPSFGPTEAWWAYPLAGSVASVLIGGAAWLGHWLFAERLLADPGWRGASERPARLRLTYYLIVIVVTAAVAVAQLSGSVAAALRAAFGVSDATEAGQIVGLVVLPLLGAVIFGLACWFHRRWLAREADALALNGRVRTAGRLQEYGIALVGLAFAAVGVSGLIGVVINAVLTGGRTIGGDLLPVELAANLPMALFGAALWIWSWGGANARHAAAPADEAGSTSRRAAVLIVLAVSVLAGIASLGVILYRAFGTAFGAALGGDAAAELSRPIGVLLVAVAAGLYHTAVLRRDQALRPAADAETPVAAVAPATTDVVLLRLIGPAGADVAGAAAALRASLPAGFALETVAPDPTRD